MFLEHFGLREQPFGVTPDPRFLFLGASHREAMASLRYGIEADRGFLAIIARPGMGKTTLLFQLLEQMRSTAHTVFVFHTQCGARELLRYILQDAGVDARETDIVRLHDQFNNLLAHEARAGRRFIIVVDEAQNLDDSGLETLRLLSNFETSRAKLLQIVLAGQPQLASKLAGPSLAQLRQRLSIVCRLVPLTHDEVHEYVVHRLRAAGSQQPEIFSVEAMQLIAERSEGIPRNINNLCFNSLSTAFATDRDIVTSSIVREVIADLDLQGILEPPSYLIDDDSEECVYASVFASVFASSPPLHEGFVDATSRTPFSTALASLSVTDLGSIEPHPAEAVAESLVSPVAEACEEEHRASVTAVGVSEYVPSGLDATSENESDLFAAWRNLPPPPPAKRTFRLRLVSPRSVLLAFGVGLVVFTLAFGALQWTAAGPSQSANAAAPEGSFAKPESDNAEVAETAGQRRIRNSVGKTAKRQAPAVDEQLQRFATVQNSKGNFAIPTTDSMQDKTSQGGAPNSNTISEENQLAHAASSATPGRDAYVDVTTSGPPPSSTDAPRQLFIPAAPARVPSVAAVYGERAAISSPTLQEGKLVSYIKPVYPQQALRSHLEGTVILRAIISPSGSVRAADHLSGDRLLSAAAINAVKKWKYEPFLLNGRPTEVEKQITVSFSIPD